MNLLDRIVRRLQRTDAMFVAESRGYALRVMVLDAVLFVGVVCCWAALPVLNGWGRALAGIAVGLQLGRAGLVAYRRAAAYRSGWLKGRSQMVFAMAEAQRRGMSIQEWLETEVHRDYAVLGMTADDMAEIQRRIQEEEG